jgi:hypothetical protein
VFCVTRLSGILYRLYRDAVGRPLARAAFAAAIAEKPACPLHDQEQGRVMKRHPEGDW